MDRLKIRVIGPVLGKRIPRVFVSIADLFRKRWIMEETLSKEETEDGAREEENDKLRSLGIRTDPKARLIRELKDKERRQVDKSTELLVEGLRSEPISIAKTAGVVAANTAINRICGLEIEKLKEKADESSKNHPKTSMLAGYGSIYLVGRALTFIGKQLAGTFIGQAGGYTLAFTMPFLVNAATSTIRSKEAITNIFKKGNCATFSAVFSIIGLVSAPFFYYVIEIVAGKSEKLIEPLQAVGALAVATITVTGIEWIMFREMWKRIRKNTFENGNWKDFWKGFRETFNPLNIIRKKASQTPENASQEAGQLFGISESYYIWVQSLRFATGAVIGMLGLSTAKNFLEIYLDVAATYGIWVAMDMIGMLNTMHISQKLEETKEYIDRIS